MVPPFWVFQGWHSARSDRNGPGGLVSVVNGSVGTVTSRHHTGHSGGPAIVTSHNGRYLVYAYCTVFYEQIQWWWRQQAHNKGSTFQSTSKGSRTCIRFVNVGSGKRKSFIKISISSHASWTWRCKTSSASTVRQCFSNLYKSRSRLAPSTWTDRQLYVTTYNKVVQLSKCLTSTVHLLVRRWRFKQPTTAI